MAIIRGDIPTDGYTIVDNLWLRDRRLSYKAKGILAAIASHAAGYRLSTAQLIDESADGRDAVRTGLVELEKFGYLRRIELREGGRVCGYDFVLTCPSSEGGSGFTGDGKPVTGADLGEQGDGEPADGGLSGAGESVTGADLGERGLSAGGTATGFSGDGGSPPKKTILKKTIKKTKHSPSESAAPASRTRGTRIPASFTVTDAMRAWAVADATKVRQSPPDPATFADWLDRHTQQFCDHWTGKTGSDAVKLDWVATWRKWIRTEIDKVAQQRSRSLAPTSRRSENRHIDDLPADVRSARNPFTGAVHASKTTPGGSS